MRRKPPTTTGASQSRRSARRGSTTATLDRSRTIHLPRGTWVLEPTPLGRGGFGAVFPGKGEDGREVAVKQLDPLAKLPIDRELQVTEGLVGRNCAHVIPILDVGRDATGDVFIVMARATESLDVFLTKRGARPEGEAIDVLRQIVAGIEEIGDVVHRDLKPANVLLHEGRWKVADFGLVRLADAATSTHTVKLAFTPQYAAPEQWHGERATHATDVYSLGCIAYTLLTGAPPFPGPAVDDLRAQHRGQAPAPLPVSPPLQHLLLRCLQKPPDSRPSLVEVREGLERAANPGPAKPLLGLQQVAARLAAAQAADDAARAVRLHEAEERRRLADAGMQSGRGLLKELFERLRAAAPNAPLSPDGRSIRLGRASLSYKEAFPLLSSDAFPRSAFPAIAGVFIELRQENASYPGRSANLWLAKLDGEGFRWWEAAYMTSPLIRSRRADEPYGVESSTEIEAADRAAGPAMDTIQYAMKLTAIDDAGREAFIERWAERFAAAAAGTLDHPRYLPE